MTEKILKNNQAVVAGEIISDFEFSHEVFGEGFYFEIGRASCRERV